MTRHGKFLGLRVNTLANIGGYISTFGPNIPTNLYGPLLAGVYLTPAIYCEVKVVFTNTVPVDAYRGAGRPEATFVLERLVDVAASDLGIDKAEIRRRNMIPKEAYPYQTPVMVEYDSGDPKGCLEKALAVADWAELCQAQVGIPRAMASCAGSGSRTYVEACGLAPSRIAGRLGARGGLYESATVRVHPTGQITVLIGTHNHGQGHETTYAQIVCEKLGVPFDNIDIVFGDTDKVQFGMGTYGSRSLVVGGAALSKASRQDRRSRARKSPPIFWKAASRTSSSRPASSRSPGPIARRPSPRSRSRPMCRTIIRSKCWNPGSRSKPTTIRSTSPIRAARTSPRSRSIRRPASSASSITPRSTTSAP